MSIHLVTGHTGSAHVTSNDVGSFHACTLTGGMCVLDKGEKFAAAVLDNNTIRIKDDGVGFNPESEQLGVGIPSMNDRVKMLGGTFHLYSMEGKGTEIIMEVPYHEGNV